MSKPKPTLEDRILELLQPRHDCDKDCMHQMTSEQIAKNLGVDKPDVDRELSLMKGKNKVETFKWPARVSQRTYWQRVKNT